MCDHTIGYLDDELVQQSEVADKLKNEAAAYNRHSDNMRSAGLDYKKYKNNYRPKDFLDRRKGLMTMFNNCPYCGKEINWRDIKESI